MAYTTNYMPNTNQGYDYGVGVVDQQQRDEEERRRLAALAAAAAGVPISPDAVQVAAAPTATATDAGNLQMVGGKLRVNPTAAPAPEPQAVAPQAPMQAPPATNAESLRAAQMAAAGQMPTAPVSPQPPQPQQAFMPEMAEFESVEQQTQDPAQTQAMDQFLAAQNDPFRLMELAKDPSQPETLRRLSSEQAYRQLTNQREQEKAQEKIKSDTAKGDFLSVADSIRGGRKGNEQGSWARYIMLKALDNDAAKVEGSKLGLFDTWTRSTVTDPITGQQKIVQVLQSGTGKLLRGTDLQGNELSPEELNTAAVATNYGKSKPDVIGNVEKDGKAGRIVTTFDAQNRPTTMVESGGKMYPYDTTWKSRDISAAATKDTFRTTLALAQKFGTNVLEAEKQYEIDAGPFGSAGNPMSREDFRRQYNFSLNQVPGVSTGTTATPPAAAPAAAPPAAAAPVVPTAPTAAPVTQTQKPAAVPVIPQTQTQTNRPVGGGGVAVGAAPQRRDYPSQTAFNIAKERYDAQQKLNNQIAAEAAGAEIQRKKEMRLAEEKPAAAAAGIDAAATVKNQAFADRTYGIMKQIDQEIRKSTGSSLGAGFDTAAAAIGVSTEGSKAIARLNMLSYSILSNIPRFEGPQSDIDVQQYRQAAGEFNNRQLPIEDRLAALGVLNSILQRYDKAGKNDWTYGTGGASSNTGTTSSGNKYKKVQ